jgi:uncharacterized protein (TIGR00297 family)
MAVVFTIMNFLALRSGKLQGMHSISRKSYGTIYFPLAFLVLSIFWWSRPVTIVIAMILMTLADTFAAISGEKFPSVRSYVIWQDKKTVEGSVVMYLTAFLLVLVITTVFSHYTNYMSFISLPTIIMLAGFIAAIASIAESTSQYGSDNISVPIISAIVFDQFFINLSYGQLLPFLTWSIVSLILMWAAFRLKVLSSSGAVTAFLTGVIIFGAGGVQWISPLIVFFILSSVISKFRRAESGKHSNRNIYQVLANGGVPMVVALLHFYYQFPFMYIFYLSAIAAATADTWATEIGFFSRKQPRNILTWQTVKRGDSGGITVLGTVGSLAGAAFIALCGIFFEISTTHILIVTLAGFAGSLIDSLLGASVQGIYFCKVCSKSTEKRMHCDQATKLTKGFIWIDNNMVNLMNTIGGVVIISILINLI